MQLSSLVRQSFDIFNVYGKDPSSVENIILGFSIALEEYDIQDISKSFKQWMKSSSAMPAPADIAKLCEESKSYRVSVSKTPAPAMRALPKPCGMVPWYNLPWREAEQFSQEICKHFSELDKPKREGYASYLVYHMKWPRDKVEQLSGETVFV